MKFPKSDTLSSEIRHIYWNFRARTQRGLVEKRKDNTRGGKTTCEHKSTQFGAAASKTEARYASAGSSSHGACVSDEYGGRAVVASQTHEALEEAQDEVNDGDQDADPHLRDEPLGQSLGLVEAAERRHRGLAEAFELAEGPSPLRDDLPVDDGGLALSHGWCAVAKMRRQLEPRRRNCSQSLFATTGQEI